MGSWAEKMIVQEVQEKSRTNQKETAFQDKMSQEKIHKASTLAMRLFHIRHIDSEWFWRFIAYTYFICKTLGLLILIGLLFLGRFKTILFTSIFLCCCVFNLKIYKYISRRKPKVGAVI